MVPTTGLVYSSGPKARFLSERGLSSKTSGGGKDLGLIACNANSPFSRSDQKGFRSGAKASSLPRLCPLVPSKEATDPDDVIV